MHHLVLYSMVLVAIVGWWWAKNILEWRPLFALMVPVAVFFLSFPLNRAYGTYKQQSAARQVVATAKADNQLAALCSSWAKPDWIAAHRWRELALNSGNEIFWMADAHNKGATRFSWESGVNEGIAHIKNEAQLDDVIRFHSKLGMKYSPAEVQLARLYLRQPAQE